MIFKLETISNFIFFKKKQYRYFMYDSYYETKTGKNTKELFRDYFSDFKEVLKEFKQERKAHKNTLMCFCYNKGHRSRTEQWVELWKTHIKIIQIIMNIRF